VPITEIFWGPIDGPPTSNQDIHVLRGETTRDLTVDDLFFTPAEGEDLSAHDYLAANNDVGLTFQPLFNGTRAGNVFSGLGIDVNTRIGQVSPGLAARKNNFIIEVTATDPADGSAIDTETIRVHIHLSVKAFTLTPATLTVRPAASTRTNPETTHYRFTVRAKFDDDTMGDLTEHHGVIWSSDPPGHVNPDTHIDPNTQKRIIAGELIILPGDMADNTVTITATLPAELGGGTQTATMKIGRAWRDDPHMPVAPIIAGGGWPGTTLPDTAPNILFIGDGYIDSDHPAFVRTVTTMVHHLKTDRLLRPYDLLCTSMNFWHAEAPASAPGISFRCEVYDKNGNGAGRPVPPPEPPPTDGDWELGHLIYAVGLPVPKDAGTAELDLRLDWGLDVGELPEVPQGGIKRWVGELPDDSILSDDVIKDWKRIASRAFIEELDNFPGMAFGAPPAANTNSGTPELFLHPHRCGRDGLDSFLVALQSAMGVQFGPGANIGALWATPPRRQNLTEYELKDVITPPRPMRQNFTQYELNDFITVPSNRAGLVFVCTAAGTSDRSRPADYADAQAGATITDGSATFRAVQPMVFVCTTAGISDLSRPADYATAEAGATITDGSATFHAVQAVFDNPRFAIVLSSFPSGRAVNHRRRPETPRRGEIPPYIATCTRSGTHDIPLAPPAGAIGFALNFTAVPTDVKIDACRVTAHELGHSLGLGDEYAEEEGTYPSQQDHLAGRLNLQTKEDTEFNGEIHTDLIRWNWHRVRKAAVVRAVVGDPDPIKEVAPGAFRIPVVAGHASQFLKDDTVLLRLRVPGRHLSKAADVEVSAALQIAVEPSKQASTDFLVVQAAPGVTVTLDDLKTFTPGSVLFAPVPAPSSVRDEENPYAKMVALNIEGLMDRHEPLYRRPAGNPATEEKEQQPDLEGLNPGLPRPFCFKHKERIVGLYEGGAQYARGIFHPTGKCIMRQSRVDAAEFCAVCRYIMVDFVDPFRHFEIDRDYDEIYPLGDISTE
jgi:hypothetical protein